MTDEEGVIHCESPEEMRQRVLEDLAEDLGCSVEDVTADGYEIPDPDDLESVPADEFYDE